MADLFGIRKQVEKYETEKPRIELLKRILEVQAQGKRSVSICFPEGASDALINFLRTYGFKAHNIEVKDPQIKNAKACLVQW